MEDLSLHILDIVENATTAGATFVEITIQEDKEADLLTLTIRDNGRGMTEEMARKARSPFGTTRTTRRVGLGIPLLEQSARETGGRLRLESTLGKGTCVTAVFQVSHVDRRPLGDIGATLISLIMGSPDVDFRLELRAEGADAEVDTREMRDELGDTPINSPEVLALIAGLFGGK